VRPNVADASAAVAVPEPPADHTGVAGIPATSWYSTPTEYDSDDDDDDDDELLLFMTL
jgi:hypothetical protein